MTAAGALSMSPGRPSWRARAGALLLCATLVAGVGLADPASAQTITPVGSDDAGALALAQAAVSQPGILSGARFDAVPPGGAPHGVSGPLSHFPTAGGSFGLLTTGSAAIAGMDNTSESSGADLGGTAQRGNTDLDVTVLAIDLVVPAGRDCLRFDFAFYSEEYPEWVGSSYNDAFIAELDQSTWTTSGSTINAPDNFAFDPDGRPVSINSSGPTAMSLVNAGGTTYDGATVLLEAATPVTPGAHTLYLSIFDQGDRAYDSAAFVDNIRVEQTVGPCEPGAQTAIRRPLIFLHGITGSFLQDGDGNEVWPDEGRTADSFGDEHLDVLRLAADGITADPPDPDRLPITVMRDKGIDGIIGVTELCVLGFCHELGDAYRTTFELLEDTFGYTRGEDLFPFAFDWRLSIDVNAGRLQDKIDEVLAATDADKVNILAHSQGGLVASSALHNPASTGTVARVVTLGTPYLGATKFLGVLGYREPCQAEVPANLPGCFLNRAKAQELTTNWPGALALLPSRAFFEAYFSPVHRQVDDDGDGVHEGFLPFAAVRAKLADRNLALIDQADALHGRIDRWNPADPEVRLMRIIGDTSPTIVRIIEFQEEHCSGILWWRSCEMREAFQFQNAGGDGTVPLHSADVHTAWLDLRGTGQNAYAGGVEHGELARERSVLDFAMGFLSAPEAETAMAAMTMGAAEANESTLAALHAPPREAPAGALSVAAATTAEDPLILRDEPLPLSGTEIVTRGPLQGMVVDSGEGMLGTADPERGIELQTVRSATFSTAGARSSYFVTRDDAYEGDWVVTEDGEVRVVVRLYQEDEVVAVAAAPALALPAGARLSLRYAVPTALGGLALEVDEDGDGTPERTMPFGAAVTGEDAADLEAPVSTVSVERGVNSTGEQVAMVTISATDTGGAGVDRIEYALDASEQTGLYTGPLEVPAVGLMYVRAIDRAGNVEAPYQVVALDEQPDDAPNARTAVNEWHRPHVNLSALIDYAGDVDWWGIEVESGRHALQLIGLRDDYGLALYDGAGALLASGDRSGKVSERIVHTLAAGRYYLRVHGIDGAHDAVHAYRLNVTRLGDR